MDLTGDAPRGSKLSCQMNRRQQDSLIQPFELSQGLRRMSLYNTTKQTRHTSVPVTYS
jgi:hypothetical protein